MWCPPPTTGHSIVPPWYVVGGRTELPLLPLLPLLCDDGRDVARGLAAGRTVGFGVGMPPPRAPGMPSVWPMTRLGSPRPFASRMVFGLTSYFAASESSVSALGTSKNKPDTWGTRRAC